VLNVPQDTFSTRPGVPATSHAKQMNISMETHAFVSITSILSTGFAQNVDNNKSIMPHSSSVSLDAHSMKYGRPMDVHA